MRGGPIIIETSESPDRCVELLRTRLSPVSLAVRLETGVYSRQFIGDVTVDRVRIRPIGPTTSDGENVWHSWTPGFKGRITPSGQGSRLEGRISLNPFVLAVGLVVAYFLLWWILAAGGPVIERLIAGGPVEASELYDVAVPVSLGLIVLLMYAIGLRLYRRDRAELTAFLRESIHGVPSD